MANKDANLKPGWKNLLIWMPVMVLIALILRMLMWKFLVYDNMEISVEQYSMIMALLLVSVLWPLIGYFSIYMTYSSAGAVSSTSLREVARSKKWIVPFLVFCALEVVWCLISILFLLITGNGGLPVSMYFVCLLVSMIVDIILVICGRMYFKPDRIQQG